MDFGDAEAAAIDIVEAAELDLTVSTDLIGYEAPARWVRVYRVGGVPTRWMALDNAAIKFEVYANGKGDALDVATAVRAAVYAARGEYAGHGLAVYDVSDVDGMAWEADEATPRYVFTLALISRPAA